MGTGGVTSARREGEEMISAWEKKRSARDPEWPSDETISVPVEVS